MELGGWDSFQRKNLLLLVGNWFSSSRKPFIFSIFQRLLPGIVFRLLETLFQENALFRLVETDFKANNGFHKKKEKL